MQVEQAIGRRITQLRERKKMTQAQLGAELEMWVGKPWARQTVSMAEQGQRKFIAAELFGIASILGVHVAQLFVPPLEIDELEFPGGKRIPGAALRGPHAADPESPTGAAVTAMQEIAKEVVKLRKRIGEDTADAMNLEKVHEKLANSLGVDSAAPEEAAS